MEQRWRLADFSALFLRLALATAFLSAVADRFGLWGSIGQPQVGWGDFSHFIAYTERLTSILPISLGPTLAWAATVAETTLALALLIGWFTRVAAFLSGVLLLLFALAMTFALGIKAPFDFSVYTASAAAFLLADYEGYKLSLDGLIRLRKR
ncbi:MAG: DoxX family protein [Acidobacteriales bacterium 59-55]|nr:DoxX family membrane protein [Terriglobales bacterium]OJV39498.1 MAG: DoxX family protein [Acidobacteriales bacterium 59-55]